MMRRNVQLTNGESATLTRHDDYALVGRWLGSRQIEKEIGYPVYNDEGDVWLSHISGFASATKRASGVWEFRYIYVMPQHRRMGTGRSMCLEILGMSERWMVRANRNSEAMFTSFGFVPVSGTKNFTKMVRGINA